MKKRILSLALVLAMLAAWVPTAWATGAPGSEYGYDSNWKYWSQAGTQYVNSSSALKNNMTQYGCAVVSMAKMLVESGCASASSFNPDTWLDYLISSGNMNNSFNITSWNATAGYTSQKLKYIGSASLSGTAAQKAAAIQEKINSGYFVILKASSPQHYTYVLRQDSLSAGYAIISRTQRDAYNSKHYPWGKNRFVEAFTAWDHNSYVNSMLYYALSSNPNYSSPSAPTNTWVKTSCGAVTTSADDVRISWLANDATSYWLHIYKDGTDYINRSVGSDTSLTQKFPAGSYRAYIEPWNSAGAGPLGYADFTIVGTPTNTWVKTSCGAVTTSADDVRISWLANDATSYWLHIYKDGTDYINRSVGSDTSLTQKFPAGSYRAYIEPWNSAGAGPLGYADFTIVGTPINTWVKASCSENATIDDSVSLTWGGDNATAYWLHVYRDGETYINKDTNGSTSITQRFPEGVYRAYIEPWNSAGKGPLANVDFTIKKVSSQESKPELASDPRPEPDPEPEPDPDSNPEPETAPEAEPEADPTIPAVHFSRVNVYHQDQFTDVKANQWFTPTIASAFEMGLVKGDSSTTYNPYGNVTVAEAITMAARIHSIYTTGKEGFVQSGKWYQVYLDYAYYNDIISVAYYNSDVNQNATRAQFAEIFANALPEIGLYPINKVAYNAIPDVKMSANYADSVYKLYRAGILAGSDRLGTFNPDTYITRAEAATILARMGESDNRQAFSMR